MFVPIIVINTVFVSAVYGCACLYILFRIFGVINIYTPLKLKQPQIFNNLLVDTVRNT